MPSKSASQQRFMALVLQAKRGKKAASPAVAKAAKSMTAKSAKEFASTKRKGLPVHKGAVLSALKRKQKYD